MESQKAKRGEQSIWNEAIYLLKLTRSIVLYNYRYDEAYEVASWRRLVILTIVTLLLGTIIESAINTAFVAYVDWTARTSNVFVNLLSLLTSFTDDPLLTLWSFVYGMAISIPLSLLLVIILAYAIRQFLIDDTSKEQVTLVQLAFGVAIIDGVYSLVIYPITVLIQLLYVVGMSLFGFDLSIPMGLMIALGLLAIILIFHIYRTLYRYIKEKSVTESHSLLRFVLILFGVQFIAIVLASLVGATLLPLYQMVARTI
ncbi:MAG: hypothetical protein AAF846_29285 [Chloroflexota bacterium]